MHISGQRATIIISFLVTTLVCSAISLPVNGLSAETDIAGSAASKVDSTSKNATQDSNASDSKLINSNPFEDKDSILKLNDSEASNSQDNPSNKEGNNSTGSTSHSSDSACTKDGKGVCKDKQKTSKKDNNDSKNKDGTGDNVQKRNSKPDVKALKEKIKSEVKDHIKLPIDIPFP
jgi:hypothetical protein